MTSWMRAHARWAGAGWTMVVIVAVAGVCLAGAPATAQTYGLATMQPGTLAHTTGTAHDATLRYLDFPCRDGHL